MFINKFTYEIKRIDKYEVISEEEVINILYKTHRKITPIIKEMLAGKEIASCDGILKLTVEV